ncbi:MAG: ParB/RepB/Spo0J family partition protein [Rhodospirillales bacterium]|jgi:ParB family transcriptional regulator, chromosome partitioning protein
MAAQPKRGLGRGLSSLLGNDTGAAPVNADVHGVKQVPVEFLHPGKYQPRQYIDDDAIKDLAHSIEEKGILLPLLVRQHPDEADRYEIIAGERRWRAAQLAKVHEVPVIIKDLNDQEVLEVALIENLQRQDLSPLEEADGYQRLMDEFSHKQEDLAKVVGKSRSHVANMMRLLGLPDPVKKMLNGGELSIGHARALLNATDSIQLARQVVKQGLNVRQTEKLTQKTDRKKSGKDGGKATGQASNKVSRQKDADTLSLENDLTLLLGLRTEIQFNGEGGAIVIHYNSLDQLDDILLRLSDGSAPAAAPVPIITNPDPTDGLQTFEAALTPDHADGPLMASEAESEEPKQ